MKINIYNDKNREKIKIDKTISVIVPNYNYSKFIIERIDSILFQTIEINELIILDDASTDNSVEVINKKIDEIKKEYPNIKVKFIVNEKNSGGSVFSQWQKGLKEVNSDYFWIAEADDSSNCKFLETAMNFFNKEKDLTLFYTESKTMDANNNITKENCKDWMDIFNFGHWDKDYINDGKDEIINYLSSNNTILNVSSIVWKYDENLYNIFEEAKKYKIAGDWYIYSRVLEKGKIGFSHHALNYFRKHGKSVSTLDIRDKEYKEVYEIQEFIKNKYKLNDDLIEKQRIRRVMMGYTENKNNNGTKGKVAWFVPMLLKGSGGHRTIFQNINALIKEGYSCDVYVGDFNMHSPAELLSMINEYYGEFNGDVFADWNNPLKEYDVCVATAYNSAPIVNRIDCKKKMYFIQDFEPYFFPIGTDYITAENTYKYGFYGITIGKWLSHKMRDEFNLKTSYFHFCADLNVYKKLDNVKKEDSICFIFQPDKPRRCDIIALKALQLVKEEKPNIKIYTYGSIKRNINNLDVEQLGIIPIEECNELYNKCRVGICMSASNPSRIPFEMMAAGLPVVELYRDNNLYDFPDGGVMLSDSTPSAIATSILNILDDEKLQEKMSKEGIKFMKDYPLEKGYEEFIDAFNNFYNNKNKKEEVITKSYKKDMIKGNKELDEEEKRLPEVSFDRPIIKTKKASLVRRGYRKIKRVARKIIKK